MKTIEYTITDALGIHARPAGLLVKEAGKFASKIMIASPKKEVDAKRIMGVMGLGVKGDDITSPALNGDEIGGRKLPSALPSFNTIGRFGGPQNKEGKLL